jgi:F420-dependent oxidoreductase-like protein
MVAISIMIEGQRGLTWPHWKHLASEVDRLGFAGLFRSDHFTDPEPPDLDSLEMIISLAYLADRTEHIHFGPLVAPISFREPTLLARQAAAIDDLSGGRLILGLGAGWQEREHHKFGHDLSDMKTRLARFEEGLEVITRLLHSDEPVTFEGKFFQLHDAILLPRPQRAGGPQILIGGNGIKRTLPLAARYADIWNAAYLSPEDFKERSVRLDSLLSQFGRQPADLKRTLMHQVIFGSDTDELEPKLSTYRQDPALRDLSTDALVAALSSSSKAIVGTAEQIIQQIHTYEQAGVEEIMLQWFDLDNIDGLQAFATSILPHL